MNYQPLVIAYVLSLFVCSGILAQQDDQAEPQLWCQYEPAEGTEKRKRIVLIAGDDEYRSEEALPMLGKILAMRHGFQTTVLFPINPEENVIQPDFQTNIPGMHHLDDADLVIIGLRFRNLPDEQMKHFVDAYHRGVPIIGLRTSTHAFRLRQSSYQDFNSFGKNVLGEGWVSHWGGHKREGCRGVVEAANQDHPILRGATDVFADSDTYEAAPPEDATILMRGLVTDSLKPDSKPVQGKTKKNRATGQEQDVNDPAMPVVWTRELKNPMGNSNRLLCTTMGAATDFQSEGLRRLVVNGVYWGLAMEDKIDGKANVDYVDPYSPTPYGFGNFKKDKQPADYNLKNKSAK